MTRITSLILGTLLLLLATLAVAVPSASAVTETILHNFSPIGRGNLPDGAPIADAAGNLYGVTSNGGDYDGGLVYELAYNSHGGWTETVLYSFGGPPASDAHPLGRVKVAGYSPNGPLLFDAAGNLYGTTFWGGKYGFGTVFELTPGSGGSWTEQTLYSFTGLKDGSNPEGGLSFDPAGNLYGATFWGGGNGRTICINGGCGTVFRLTLDSTGQWNETVLYAFQGTTDGAYPAGSLAFDGAGNLYGTTSSGGGGSDLGYGVVFEIAPSSGGWSETVLYTFSGGADGAHPSGGVVFDQTGNLYGATGGGGGSTGCYNNSPCGAIFKLTPGSSGWTETVIYSFQGGSDGQGPNRNLIFDHAGNLYGTTFYGGGTLGPGTVFELTPGSNGQWTESLLWSFTGGPDGERPNSGVTLGPAGQAYATASTGSIGNGTVIELAPANGPWSETTLTDFPYTDGGSPETSLIADASGNFYGTTSVGGAHGCGSVFELTSSNGAWNETALYSFKPDLDSKCAATPSALVFDSAGNLYGENANGGQQNAGSIFELSPGSPGWTYRTIYVFNGEEGSRPYGGLVVDQAGNLYGTTKAGGSPGCGFGCGSVFELSPVSGGHWTETLLYRFAGGSDGAAPVAGLIFDNAGNLYGTTPYGGQKDNGTVFKLAPSSGSWTETILYRFTNTRGDGRLPMASLVLDQAGNLYGTTSEGGYYGGDYCYGYGCGIVFELSPNSGAWAESVLLSFSQVDGSYPVSTLVLDSAGNLYGTTEGGLGYVWGTVFELSPASGGTWNETVLHIFPFPSSGNHDGYGPFCGVIRDSLGNLYGTTVGGGHHNGGTVFEITP